MHFKVKYGIKNKNYHLVLDLEGEKDMVAEVFSGMPQGIKGELIRIQADISNGLPSFYMIGYLSSEVKESRERVRTALKNIGISLPAKRISVNFAPADFRKYGTFFDIAVAVSLLLAMRLIPDTYVKDTIFIGELSLSGEIQPVSGILPIVIACEQIGIKKCIVATANVKEASFAESLEIQGFHNLEELYFYLKHGECIDLESGEIIQKTETANPTYFIADTSEKITDFSEICGQIMAKRAMEISAAGYHNLLLGGPPGVGKSMLASSISGIMPNMTKKEMLDTTMIYSVKGLLKKEISLIDKRPFRAPSLAITQAGMFGGGVIPQPGEISLAHHGVLFLDEFPEYTRDMIEMFRIPLEKHFIQLTRKEKSIIFPADFLLIAAANSCPCGYYPLEKCHCSYRQIKRYQNKISGAILDRIDLFVRCEEISYDTLTSPQKEESSILVKKRVSQAWEMQTERFEKSTTVFNSRMTNEELKKYCKLDEQSQSLMKAAFTVFSLTGRSYFKILKIARTIADLDHSSSIKEWHLEEALHFRQKEREVTR